MSNKNSEECYMILKDKTATATDHHIPRNNKRKAQILNTYFTSVFTHEELTEIPLPHALNTQEILSDGVITVEELEEQISILNPYKSTGPDGLGPRILKETPEVISEPLTNIFNRSLKTGIVPDDWKRANVTPIVKKGNKQTPNNYHSISLTSVISKTIERLLKESLDGAFYARSSSSSTSGVGKVVDIDPWGSRTELNGSINLWGSEGGRLRIYMVEAGFSHANAIITKQRNRLNLKNDGDLQLKLTNFKPNINSLAAAHQAHPSH
ncbi:hypothetical protein FHG87_021303 [Trinorchestia longiramus]|nr:hypothetical protein FHG87_021303 [Trinorchestia longiramus]